MRQGRKEGAAPMPTKSWRNTLLIHPAAKLFPRMSADELKALGDDILRNGLQVPIALWAELADGGKYVIDGVNRLDAMEMVGIPFDQMKGFQVMKPETDPYAFAISMNIERRHLTADQKRDLIAKVIKADPSKSDRQIAATVKASPTFVGKVRAEKEATGDVSTVDTRTDSRGRQQPAHRPTSASRKPDTTKVSPALATFGSTIVEANSPSISRRVTVAAPPPRKDMRDDVGESSTAEAARLQARIEELQAEKRRLEIKLKGYESEIEELRAERAPQVDRRDLSMTAQEKFDAAIRQHKRKQDMEFEARCREDCRRWLNEVSLPQYTKEISEIERSIRSRKGVMDRITYRKILACLHPDRVQDHILKKRYEEAFRLFTDLEKHVLDEKQSPTQFRSMPRTYEELMAMKAKVQAERRQRAARRRDKENPPPATAPPADDGLDIPASLRRSAP
jgi:hypothetical protein